MPPEPGTDGEHLSFCRLCEANCGLRVTVAGGRVAAVLPDRDHPVSEGHICVKGARMADIVHDPARVTTPLRRTGAAGEFAPVSWDEALDEIAARLAGVIDRHGGDAVAAYMGNPASFATMHPAYFAGFLGALGSTRGFNSLHVDTAPKNLAMELTYGNPYRYSFPDLEDCDFLIIIGGNPAVSHMSLISEPRVLPRLDAIAARGGVVVLDPRRTETARRYEHLGVRPDGDVWVLATMLRTIFAEGLFDAAALDQRAAGWRELRAAVEAIAPEQAAMASGIDAETMRALARRFAKARTAACYGRLGSCRGRFSTLTNLLIEALNVVTGRLGQAGGWVIAEGAIPKGNRPFPAHGSRRSRVGDLPLLLGTAPGGTMAAEMLTPGPGQIRAFFVDSGNPVLSYPRGDVLAEALEGLELMVALDLYVTETSRHAHFILPATTFLERPDLNDMWGANAPRPWLQYSAAVIPPVGQARTEYEAYAGILARMGRPAPLAAHATPECPAPDPIAAVDKALRAGPHGLSIARLHTEFPHGYRLAERVNAPKTAEMIAFADGKARLWGDVAEGEFARLADAPAGLADGELALFGRRRLQALNSWMHNSERLTRGDRPTLQLHPDDAARAGVADGAPVRVSSSEGELVLVAEVTDAVVPGSACYPHGYGHNGGWERANALPGANINLLASARPEDWEQVSGSCRLDGIPIRIAPA